MLFTTLIRTAKHAAAVVGGGGGTTSLCSKRESSGKNVPTTETQARGGRSRAHLRAWTAGEGGRKRLPLQPRDEIKTDSGELPSEARTLGGCEMNWVPTLLSRGRSINNRGEGGTVAGTSARVLADAGRDAFELAGQHNPQEPAWGPAAGEGAGVRQRGRSRGSDGLCGGCAVTGRLCSGPVPLVGQRARHGAVSPPHPAGGVTCLKG